MDWRDDRIIELETLLGLPPVGVRPPGILPVPWKIAGILSACKGVMTRDYATSVLYGSKPENEQPESLTIIDAHVCRLRRGLKAYGIKIQTQSPDGYYLLPEDREKLLRLIKENTP